MGETAEGVAHRTGLIVYSNWFAFGRVVRKHLAAFGSNLSTAPLSLFFDYGAVSNRLKLIAHRDRQAEGIL
jgi:hypothetical protein